MARILMIACIALIAGVAVAEEKSFNLGVQVIEDINKFRSENPGVKLTPLAVDPRGRIRYTLGNRIAGDRLVAQGSNSYTYPTLQDVQLRLNYPTSGTGAVVTFVEVVVNQASNLGSAYVVGGGIGQRFIQVLVEAKRTNYFQYQAAIYGY